MSRDHWDAVIASAPLNAVAGRVTSKGIGYEQAAPICETSWDGPPTILRPSATHLRNASFVDLTGTKVGRLTVLGMAADESHAARGALWVCRCACGRYVGRRAKPLKCGATDRCDVCNNTAQLAKHASGNNARQRAESPKARKW